MAYSEVEIVNIALNSLGKESIKDFSVKEDDPKTGRLAERLYQITRDSLISRHDWSFARATKELRKLTETHPEGVLYKLPSDCFVPRRLHPRGGLPNFWRVEGSNIMIPESHISSLGTTPYLRYTKYISTTSSFPPYFTVALAKAVELALCMPLTKDKKMKRELQSEARAYFGQAAFIDSNLDAGDDHHELDKEYDSFIDPDGVGVKFYG